MAETKSRPDVFQYSITSFPLHFLPYETHTTIEKDAIRLRNHTQMIIQHIKENNYQVSVSDLLPSGETLGEAIVCWFSHARERRAKHDTLFKKAKKKH